MGIAHNELFSPQAHSVGASSVRVGMGFGCVWGGYVSGRRNCCNFSTVKYRFFLLVFLAVSKGPRTHLTTRNWGMGGGGWAEPRARLEGGTVSHHMKSK